MIDRARHRDAPSLRHVPALDGMRGLAVLGVILFHARLLGVGWAGVQVFFVLSGFLISSILLAEKHEPLAFYLKRFYWRRSLRIFPLYFAFVLAIALSGVVFGFSPEFRQQWVSLVTYTVNFARIRPGVLDPHYWGHLWSLSVEEQFYLLWPIVVFLVPTRRFPWLVLSLIVLAPIARLLVGLELANRHILPQNAGFIIDMVTFLQLDAFAAGALVACGAASSLARRPVNAFVWMTVFVVAAGVINQLIAGRADTAGVLAFGYPPNLPYGFQFSWGFTLLNLWSALLILSLLQDNPLSRLFQLGPLVAIGRVSYGVYVLHLPLLRLFRDYLAWPIGMHSVSGTAAVLAYIAITLAASILSYEFFEKRFLALKGRHFQIADVAPIRQRVGALTP